MADVLRMDHINSLPQPFLVRFCGDKEWWPVNDFEVGTGLMRIDVCGKLQVKSFGEVMEIKDGDLQSHDPETFYSDYSDAASHHAQVRSIRDSVTELGAWISIWRDDVAANLKPTETSINKATAVYQQALARCDALLGKDM